MTPDSYPSRTESWRRYLTFWRPSVKRDIDAELRFHLDTRIEELIAQGTAPEAARAQALEEFGDVADVHRNLSAIDGRMARRRNRAEWVEGLRQDIAYAARSLRASPMVTGTIVLTLALGIGVNSAMFSLMDTIFLRPPQGVTHPERLHRLYRQRVFVGYKEPVYAPRFDYPHYAATTNAIDGHGMAAIFLPPRQVNMGRAEGAPRASLMYASASYFDLLGVHPAMGRAFTVDEDRLGSGVNVAVVSDAFWRRELRADPKVIGSTITLGRSKYSIIGVAPRDFTGVELDAVDVWVPIATFAGFGPAPWWKSQIVNGFQVLVQLDSTLGLTAVENKLTQLFRQPNLINGKADTATIVRFGPILAARGPGERIQEVRIASRIVGVAIIVLLIACANVVNLLLARAVRRRREIAVRLAMGISRARLIRLLVAESVLLAAMAGLAAILAAAWGGALLRKLLLPDIHWGTSPMQWRVLAFTLAIAFATGVGAGLIPALQSSDPDLTKALKAGSREGSPQRSRLRSSLVAIQAALSVLLLVGAALFAKSLSNVRELDIGYTASQLVFGGLGFDDSNKERSARVATILGEVAVRLRSAPGVAAVALSGNQPMGGISFLRYTADGAVENKTLTPTFNAVSPEFFATTGTRLLKGTGLSGTEGAPEVVVNEAFANALWPGQNPLGKCIRFGERNVDATCFVVVGVSQTARENSVIEDPRPQYYLPLKASLISDWPAGTLVVRTQPGATQPVVNEMRRLLKDAFPGGVPRITLMSDALENQYRPWRLGATLFATFGGLALIVAAVGIYSSVSYGVSQRVHEFGVRVALGARTTDVVAHVVGQGLRIVSMGIGLGAVLTLAAGRLVASLLYGVSPNDPAAMAIVAGILIVVSIVAALSPAWRAARVDPMTALRTD
jgi:putative ABC transport system permease protein